MWTVWHSQPISRSKDKDDLILRKKLVKGNQNHLGIFIKVPPVH